MGILSTCRINDIWRTPSEDTLSLSTAENNTLKPVPNVPGIHHLLSIFRQIQLKQ